MGALLRSMEPRPAPDVGLDGEWRQPVGSSIRCTATEHPLGIPPAFIEPRQIFGTCPSSARREPPTHRCCSTDLRCRRSGRYPCEGLDPSSWCGVFRVTHLDNLQPITERR